MLLGPFGEPLTTPPGLAAEMPYRFSTKYLDAETGLYSYIFRPYDPLTGRWLSRDPIEEEGGVNLYGFVENNPIDNVDFIGETIVTREDNETFRDAISNALNRVSGAELFWCKIKDKWVLKPKKNGTGKLWDDLSKGVNAPVTEFSLVRIAAVDNASSDLDWWQFLGRTVQINENVNVNSYEGALGSDAVMRKAPFEIVLWHELVGHAILRKNHPNEKWNTIFASASAARAYNGRSLGSVPMGAKTARRPDWPTIDPTIAIENEARSALGYVQRYPIYWTDTKYGKHSK